MPAMQVMRMSSADEKPMHIGLDASRVTVAQRTGTENYALQLIRDLLALDTPHRFTLYFRDAPSPGLIPDYPHATQRVIPMPRLWTHTRLAAELWRDRPDVTYVPAHALPLWMPGRAVVTLHDLGYVYFPDAHPAWSRRYLDWSTRRSAQRATHVITDSLATAKDLAAHYGVSEDKMSVIYPGVDESLSRVTDPDELAAVRARYHLPEQYLLFLGTLQPRKNIARLVQAYAQWAATQPDPQVALVLAGQQGWLYDPAWTEGVGGVLLPGYVQDDDVAALYSGALAVVFPSLHEGFGFPVLEAMRCGTPVITSHTSSLPEVAGEAALLVNSRSVDDIAQAIGRIISDGALRLTLREKGYAQAERFTWARTARQVLEVLEQAARRPLRRR